MWHPQPTLLGDVTVGVASPADLDGVITVGVASSTGPASVVTTGVAFREECGDSVVIPTDCVCAYDEIAEVSCCHTGVAFRERCRDSVVTPSDCGCDYDDIADVASSLAGDVTIGVSSSADPVSVVTAGVGEKCGDSFVIPSDSVCDYDNYFYDGQYDDCPEYYDYDDPVNYDSFPSVYGFVGPDDYDLYHDIHGSDGCGRYCCSGVVDADLSHWSENRGPDASHWSDNVRHCLQKGDVILSGTSSDVSPAAFEDSVVGTISSGGPRYGTGEAAETPQEMVVDSSVRIILEGRWRRTGCTWSTLGRCRNRLVIRYVQYPTKLCVGKFVFSIGMLKKTVLCSVQGLLPLICALRG